MPANWATATQRTGILRSRSVLIPTGWRFRQDSITRLALKADGTLWAWGYNADGELGDGGSIKPALAGPNRFGHGLGGGFGRIAALACAQGQWDLICVGGERQRSTGGRKPDDSA